jgi:hypothetical protein
VTSVAACLAHGFHRSGARVDEKIFTTEFSTALEGVALSVVGSGVTFSGVDDGTANWRGTLPGVSDVAAFEVLAFATAKMLAKTKQVDFSMTEAGIKSKTGQEGKAFVSIVGPHCPSAFQG